MSAPDSQHPPKSTASLRAALENLRRSDRSDLPLVSGPSEIAPTDRVALWSFHDDTSCRRLCEALFAANLPSVQRRRGIHTIVSVDYEDLDRANEILASHLLRYPDGRPSVIRRAYDKTIFGTLIGGAVGLTVWAGANDRWLAARIVASFAAVGGLLGYAWDGRMRKRETLQGFSLAEWLVFIALCGILFSIWKTLAVITWS